jgi:exoribonuclease R
VELAGRRHAAGERGPPQAAAAGADALRLFKVLGEARGKRGAIDFETIETMMLFNEQGRSRTSFRCVATTRTV